MSSEANPTPAAAGPVTGAVTEAGAPVAPAIAASATPAAATASAASASVAAKDESPAAATAATSQANEDGSTAAAKISNSNESPSEPAASASARGSTVFAGLRFCVRGYPTPDVASLIQSHGGLVREDQTDCNFVVTSLPAPYMERAVQDGQSVVTAEWIQDCVAQGKLSSKPRTYQPSIEVHAAELSSSSHSNGGPSASSVPAGAICVFRGWTFALSQSFSPNEVGELMRMIGQHGGEFGVLSLPHVHHLVVRSISDLPCDAAYDRSRHSSVQPNWIEQCVAAGKLSWDRECILPRLSWASLSAHPSTEDACKEPVKFADRWWAASTYKLDEPPRDLTAEFARIRAEEKQAAADAAAAAALARSASAEAGEGKAGEASSDSSDHMEISAAAAAGPYFGDYHMNELVPCSDLSVPGMLRLLLHDDVIGPALGLPYLSIPLIDLITDYLQWRRPRQGTRGYRFMRFWNPKRGVVTSFGVVSSSAADLAQRPLCHRFRSVFPFNSKQSRSAHTNAESPDDLYHHLAVAGLAVIGGAGPLNVVEAGDSYKKLWARLAEVHVDELRVEDYAQLEKMGILGERAQIVDEDGVLLFDPAAAPAEESSTELMPNPACCIPGASVVGDYAAVLINRSPGSFRYDLQLLRSGAVYYCCMLITAVSGEFKDPASGYFDYEGTSIAEATKAFEDRFALCTSALFPAPVMWKDRDTLRRLVVDDSQPAWVLSNPMPRKEGNVLYTAQYAEFCLRHFADAAAVAPSLPAPYVEENTRARYAYVFAKPEPVQFMGAQPFGAQPFGAPGFAPAAGLFGQAAQPPPQSQLSPDELTILGIQAKRYVRRVQRVFRDAPDTLATFLQIVSDAHSKSDDLDGVVARVRSLFTGTPHLLRDFNNSYLPESKRIVLDAAELQRLDTQPQEPDSDSDDEDEAAAQQAEWSSEPFSESDDDGDEQQKEPLTEAANKPAADKPAQAVAPAEHVASAAAASSPSEESNAKPAQSVSSGFGTGSGLFTMPSGGLFGRSFLLSRAARSSLSKLPSTASGDRSPLQSLAARHGCELILAGDVETDSDLNPAAMFTGKLSNIKQAIKEISQLNGLNRETAAAALSALPPHCCPRRCRFSVSPVDGFGLSPPMQVRALLLGLTRAHHVSIDLRTDVSPGFDSDFIVVTVRAEHERSARHFIRAVEDKLGRQLKVRRRDMRSKQSEAEATATAAAASEAESSAASTVPSPNAEAIPTATVASESAAPTEAASSSALPAPEAAPAVASASAAPAARARPVFSPECRACVSHLTLMAAEVATARKRRPLAPMPPPVGFGAPVGPFGAAGKWGAAPAFGGGSGSAAAAAAPPAPFGGFGAATAAAPLAFNFGSPAPAPATAAGFGFGFGAPTAAVGAAPTFNSAALPTDNANSAVSAAAAAVQPHPGGGGPFGAPFAATSTASVAAPAAGFQFGGVAGSIGSVGGVSVGGVVSTGATGTGPAPPPDTTGGFKFNSRAAAAATVTGLAAMRGLHKPAKPASSKFQAQSHTQAVTAFSSQFGAPAPVAAPSTTNPFGFGSAVQPASNANPFGFGFGAAATTTTEATATAAAATPVSVAAATNAALDSSAASTPDSSSSAAAPAPDAQRPA